MNTVNLYIDTSDAMQSFMFKDHNGLTKYYLTELGKKGIAISDLATFFPSAKVPKPIPSNVTVTTIPGILTNFHDTAGDSQGGEQKYGTHVSGAIKYKNFVPAFLSALGDMNLTGKLFSVINNNSAHHVSYVLACHAFANHGRQGANQLVINFDQHHDHGSASNVNDAEIYITCTSWGQFLGRSDNGLQGCGYLALGVGTSGNKSHSKFYFGSSELSSRSAAVAKYGQFNTSNSDVYITVDRDFMKGSETKYGGGNYSKTEGWAEVKSCLGAIPLANLVGFDVCGLPTPGTEKICTPHHDYKANVTRAIEDISTIFGYVSAR